jgi:hypothetical protein
VNGGDGGAAGNGGDGGDGTGSSAAAGGAAGTPGIGTQGFGIGTNGLNGVTASAGMNGLINQTFGSAGNAGVNGNGGAGISLTGGTNSITNALGGTIAGGNGGSGATGGNGIDVLGGSVAITNLGTITGGQGGTTHGVRVSAGTVTSLTNAQGGDSPLTYFGALPTNYNVVVRSSSEFGRLAVTSPSGGPMNFGVDNSSTLPDTLRTTVRYTNVLAGLTANDITNEGTRFTLGRYHWMLTAGTGANNWDLLAWMFSPDPDNTLLALQSNANAVQNVLAQRAATTTFALEYDCSVFDVHGLCVSLGLRSTQIGNTYADSGEVAGVLTAAYRLTPEFRIGGFIDQGFATNSQAGVDPKNTQPMLGGFAVFQQNADFSGLTLRAALAYQQGDLRITRAELTNAEPGTGVARTSALAFGGEIAYGFPVDAGWLAQPYLGLRRSDSQRGGYTETTSDSVQFPITYSRFGQVVTSGTAGLRLRGAITPQFGVVLGAGMEYDLDSKMDRYAGTSGILGLESFSINAAGQQNELRAVGSAGMRYMIASNQAIAFDAAVRQLPYGNDPSITTMLRYSIGF